MIADAVTFATTQNSASETRLPRFAVSLHICFLTVTMKHQRTCLAYFLDSADLGRRNVIVTWAGFNSNLIEENTINPWAIVGVLPFFLDKAEPVPMGQRMMNIGKPVT